jgi:hypothetical protein
VGIKKIDWSLTASILALVVPLVLGGTATYMQIQYNTQLSARELLLISATQFVASLWFGWVVSFIFSEKSFQDRQRKFAISAYRRIREIENAADRILSRTRSGAQNDQSASQCLEILKEMVIGLRATVKSSKADWGDIIGEEIKTLEELEEVERSEEVPTEQSAKKVETLLAKLPSSLEIDARQKLGSEQKIRAATKDFEAQLKRIGYIELDGFWDETFSHDIFDLPLKTTLKISMDDVAKRVGAMMAHGPDGNPVGVITNAASPLCNYPEFTRALIQAMGKSKFDAEYSEKGELSPRLSNRPNDRERHYFKCRASASRD